MTSPEELAFREAPDPREVLADREHWAERADVPLSDVRDPYAGLALVAAGVWGFEEDGPTTNEGDA